MMFSLISKFNFQIQENLLFRIQFRCIQSNLKDWLGFNLEMLGCEIEEEINGVFWNLLI